MASDLRTPKEYLAGTLSNTILFRELVNCRARI